MNALVRWFQVEYVPAHGPWYDGAIWGNLFVIPVAFVLGAMLWPPLRRRIHRFADRKLAPLHDRLEAMKTEHASHHAEQMAEIAAIHTHLQAHAAVSTRERGDPD